MVFTACWMYNWEWHENQGPLWTGKTLEPNFWDNLLSSTVGCTQWTCRWRRRCGRRRTLRSTWRASARWARRTRFTSSPTTSGGPSSSSCRSATWPSRTNSPHANELKLNYYQILPKTFQSKQSGQAAYFAAPRLLSKTSYYKDWLISQIMPILDQDKFYKNTSIQTIWPGGLFCGTATPLARPRGRRHGRSGQGGRESESYEEGPIVLDDWQDINIST